MRPRKMFLLFCLFIFCAAPEELRLSFSGGGRQGERILARAYAPHGEPEPLFGIFDAFATMVDNIVLIAAIVCSRRPQVTESTNTVEPATTAIVVSIKLYRERKCYH